MDGKPNIVSPLFGGLTIGVSIVVATRIGWGVPPGKRYPPSGGNAVALISEPNFENPMIREATKVEGPIVEAARCR